MSTIQSVERAFSVLRALAVAPRGVSEIAREVDLPKSTVSRLLATMEKLGVVDRTVDADYRLGAGLRELAGAVDGAVALASAARPHLERLSAVLGEASGLSLPEGFTSVYVAQVESPAPVQIRDYTGQSLPLHVGPAGLVFMSEMPAPQVDEYLERALAAPTPFTVVDPELIRKRLASIREDGHCWIHEEFAEGINSVAAPVRDENGRIFATVSVHGPSYRFPQVGQSADVARAVKLAARRLSLQLETL